MKINSFGNIHLYFKNYDNLNLNLSQHLITFNCLDNESGEFNLFNHSVTESFRYVFKRSDLIV